MKNRVMIILIFLLTLFLSGCTKPPGCIKTSFIGGCFGKNDIRNFKIEGELPNCLRISPHTCNGAELEVENLCKNKTIILNGDEVKGTYDYFLFVNDDNGDTIRIEDRAYDYPYPEENELILVHGIVGDSPFTISYIRTKNLC